MKLFIAADHNGFELKNKLADYLSRGGYEVVDMGDKELHPDDDFPQFASRAIQGMIEDPSSDVRGTYLWQRSGYVHGRQSVQRHPCSARL